MRLTPELFAIDAQAVADHLCRFIQRTMDENHRQGILVPFSGGLDSSTVLLLCARAVGITNVHALLLPERQGNPDAARFARLVTRNFNIHTIERDISPVLTRLGVYHFIISYLPLRCMQDWVTRTYLEKTKNNPFLKIIQGTASPIERRGFAKYNTKHRVRAVVSYQVAEENNWLVAGCAHQSEDLLGLFVKFGVDDSADIMPIKQLYRSHIVQLASYLGVPPEILQRTPNPDIIPGVSDKYLDLLGLPSGLLDLILYGIQHDLDDADIAHQLSITPEKIGEIHALVRQTRHMRNPSQSLSWDEITNSPSDTILP
jgi:NAD+ synthase